MSVSFPSLAFFQALQREIRAERERFSRLGFFDTTFGVRVLADGDGAPAEFALAFEVFDCVRISEGLVSVETDFVVEGRFGAWREMLDAIHELGAADTARSEEHTSELQSQSNLVCRLLLEKKKKKISTIRVYERLQLQ